MTGYQSRQYAFTAVIWADADARPRLLLCHAKKPLAESAWTQSVVEVRLKRDEVLSFDAHPCCLPLVRRMTSIPMHQHVTFIVSKNGSGKSTLLEAIGVALGVNAEGGSSHFVFPLGPLTRSCTSTFVSSEECVGGVRRPSDSFFLRAGSFDNVATEIEQLALTGATSSGP